MSEKLFGSDEIKLIGDSSYLLQKNNVLDKIAKTLTETGEILTAEIQNNYPQIASNYTKLHCKVSIGEKYRELPYLVMDYPRHFDDKKTFSFRVLFLWGHYFNFSIHLGSDLIDTDLLFKYISSSDHSVYFCINKNPWEHYFTDNYFKLGSTITVNEITNQIKNHGFIKIAIRKEFEEIENISDQCNQIFKNLTKNLFH